MSFSMTGKSTITAAQEQKEVRANEGIEATSKASGHLSKAIIAGTQTFTDDESQYGMVTLTGALGAGADYSKATGVTVATLFRNATTGGQTVRVRIAAGTYFTVPAGGWLFLLSSTIGVAGHSTSSPAVLATAAVVGTSEALARSDHQHKRDHQLLSLNIAEVVVTNLPAAVTEWLGGVRRLKADLTDYTQARMTATVGATPGSAGSKVAVQYSTDQSSWAYLDASAGPNAEVDSASTCETGAWVNLDAGAKADVFLRLVTVGGDGVVDPTVGLITVQFR